MYVYRSCRTGLRMYPGLASLPPPVMWSVAPSGQGRGLESLEEAGARTAPSLPGVPLVNPSVGGCWAPAPAHTSWLIFPTGDPGHSKNRRHRCDHPWLQGQCPGTEDAQIPRPSRALGNPFTPPPPTPGQPQALGSETKHTSTPSVPSSLAWALPWAFPSSSPQCFLDGKWGQE